MSQASELLQEGRKYYIDKKDYTKAFECFEKAVNLGCLDAMPSLAYCYYTGQGVKKDIIKSFTLYSDVLNISDNINEDAPDETYDHICNNIHIKKVLNTLLKIHKETNNLYKSSVLLELNNIDVLYRPINKIICSYLTYDKSYE